MSKTNVLLLTVAVVAVCLSFSGERTSSGVSAGVQATAKPEGKVETWEYKVVEYGYGYKTLKGREKAFADGLSKLSKDGWEYVGPITSETIITTTKTGFPASDGARALVVFRRPRK